MVKSTLQTPPQHNIFRNSLFYRGQFLGHFLVLRAISASFHWRFLVMTCLYAFDGLQRSQWPQLSGEISLTVTANSILGKYDHIWPHKRLTNRHLTIIYGLSRPLYSWLSRSFPFAYIFNLQSDQEIVRWLYLNRFEVSKQDDLTRLFKALETINQLKSMDP